MFDWDRMKNHYISMLEVLEHLCSISDAKEFLK